jgi:selenocysteine-specific elongation factor
MVSKERQFVIGMAGHIDHGKTALVESLTGVNTDRLKEEKERGITIDLGFAHLSENITIIDVPGHERLIKNMVAGVSTIDLVLFVVAADDGIMPQTREHLDIVNLLGIKKGIFVITKIDLVEEDWVSLVEDELRELLQNTPFHDSPIVKFSAKDKKGLPEVRRLIDDVVTQVVDKEDDSIFRLPIDRVFSKAGFGTVVTGSVISGSLKIGDLVEILPEKLKGRVRGLQSHDKEISEIGIGYRAAINLAGIEKNKLYRGQVMTIPGLYEPVIAINANLSVLKDSKLSVKNNMRLRLHLYTEEVMVRVIVIGNKEILPGQCGFVQFNLERSIYASFGDRFIVRQYSPQIANGGGIILETNPPKFRKRFLEEIITNLKRLENSDIKERILGCFSSIRIKPILVHKLAIMAGGNAERVKLIVIEMVKKGKLLSFLSATENHFMSYQQIEIILNALVKELEKFYKKYPGRAGLRLKEIQSQLSSRFDENVVEIAVENGVKSGKLNKSGDLIAIAGVNIELSQNQQKHLEQLESLYRVAGFSPPLIKDAMNKLSLSEKNLKEYLIILRERNILIFIEENIFLHREYLEELIQKVQSFFTKNKEMGVPQFKNLVNASRKFAIPLLAYLDNIGITIRKENVRVPGPKLS